MAYLSQLNVNDNDYDLKDTEARNDLRSTQTATGNPLTLTDCAPINAESLKVTLQPKQDLHGYDYPWVGGAGKNKFNSTGEKTGFTLDDGIYTINTVPINNLSWVAGQVTLSSGSYILNGGYSNDYRIYISVNGETITSKGDGDKPFVLTEQTTISVNAVCTTNASVGQQIKPMIRLATETDPTFAPYSNICPITGYTECEVESVGFNLWDEETVGGYFSTVGTWNSVSTNIASDNPIPVLPNTTYYFNTAGENGYITYWKKPVPSGVTNKTDFISRTQALTDHTFTTPNDCHAVHFNMSSTYGATYKGDICINISKTEGTPKNGDYVPYQSSNATIQFGQTVYGGVCDFVDGGTDDAMDIIDLGDLSWIRTTSYENPFFYANITGRKTGGEFDYNPRSSAYRFDAINKNADTFGNTGENGTFAFQRTNTQVFIRNDAYTDATTFKTAMTGQKICFEKATHNTIATPPTELKLLKGTNNLTADGVMQIGYQPDNVIGELKGEIEKKADNTTKTQPNYYHQYDSTTHKFSDTTRTFNPYDVANILDIMENTRQALETAINDHASLFSQWTFLAEVNSSGASVTIPSSAVRILVELYVIDFSSVNETHVICASLDAEANNPVRDEYIELHGTALNADHYVTGKAIGTDTWITTTNAVARVYYRK